MPLDDIKVENLPDGAAQPVPILPRPSEVENGPKESMPESDKLHPVLQSILPSKHYSKYRFKFSYKGRGLELFLESIYENIFQIEIRLSKFQIMSKGWEPFFQADTVLYESIF